MSKLSSDIPGSSDWLIQVPLSTLVALQGLPGQMKQLEAENAQLRRELNGLRTIQSQTIERLGDLARQLKACQPKG